MLTKFTKADLIAQLSIYDDVEKGYGRMLRDREQISLLRKYLAAEKNRKDSEEISYQEFLNWLELESVDKGLFNDKYFKENSASARVVFGPWKSAKEINLEQKVDQKSAAASPSPAATNFFTSPVNKDSKLLEHKSNSPSFAVPSPLPPNVKDAITYAVQQGFIDEKFEQRYRRLPLYFTNTITKRWQLLCLTGQPAAITEALEEHANQNADLKVDQKDMQAPLIVQTQGTLKDDQGRTPMHFIAASGNCAGIAYAKSKGLNLHAQDKNRKRVDYYAVFSGRVEMLKYLKNVGVKIDLQKAMLRVLPFAVLNGRDKFFNALQSVASFFTRWITPVSVWDGDWFYKPKLIFNQGIQYNCTLRKSDYELIPVKTKLDILCEIAKSDDYEFFKDVYAQLDLPLLQCKTQFSTGAYYSELYILDAVVKCTNNVNIIVHLFNQIRESLAYNVRQDFIVTLAAYGKTEILKYILNNWPDLPKEHRTEFLQPALHAAAQSGHVSTMQYLIDTYNLNPKYVFYKGAYYFSNDKTILDRAKESGNENAIKYAEQLLNPAVASAVSNTPAPA